MGDGALDAGDPPDPRALEAEKTPHEAASTLRRDPAQVARVEQPLLARTQRR
jgi:hypothetical protein